MTAGNADIQGPLAVVDIGANAIRMAIAQVLPEGLEVLERMQRPAHLGQDTFAQGRLSQETIAAAVGILRDYRRILDTYQVQLVRAVATSAVREAVNADAFLDRVYLATNLELEVIEPAEESRLTVGAVLQALGEPAVRLGDETLIVDVGGGSALLTLLRGGDIVASGSYRLGSIRLQEMLATPHEPARRAAELLRHQIANVVSAIRSSLPLHNVQQVIAVGGDARFAARLIGHQAPNGPLRAVDAASFDALVERVATHTPEELAREHGLAFADAETLVPALLAYQSLLHETAADELCVSNVSMRDGLLLDLVRSAAGGTDEALARSVIQSARSIGEKYHYDADHAEHVAELSVRIFDELQRDHGLKPRHRLLLYVAGLLHDVGGYISGRAHHKHSYYVVANSEIFGLRREELQIVAHAARYHRRSVPKPTHLEYVSLPRDSRMIISKIAAILRVADALDRGHAQQVREIQFQRLPGELVMVIPGVPDLTLERRALTLKADLFEDIYGLRVRLEEANRPRRRRP